MSGKEYLSQIEKMRKQIENLEREIVYLTEKVGSISGPSFSGVSNSNRSTSPPFIRDLERKEQLRLEIQDINAKIKTAAEDIELSIENVEDIRERRILMYRHVMCMTWKEIADKMSYTERWVYSLYKKALNSYEEKNSVLFSTCSS